MQAKQEIHIQSQLMVRFLSLSYIKWRPTMCSYIHEWKKREGKQEEWKKGGKMSETQLLTLFRGEIYWDKKKMMAKENLSKVI
jgi:hypothetical protein